MIRGNLVFRHTTDSVGCCTDRILKGEEMSTCKCRNDPVTEGDIVRDWNNIMLRVRGGPNDIFVCYFENNNDFRIMMWGSDHLLSWESDIVLGVINNIHSLETGRMLFLCPVETSIEAYMPSLFRWYCVRTYIPSSSLSTEQCIIHLSATNYILRKMYHTDTGGWWHSFRGNIRRSFGDPS